MRPPLDVVALTMEVPIGLVVASGDDVKWANPAACEMLGIGGDLFTEEEERPSLSGCLNGEQDRATMLELIHARAGQAEVGLKATTDGEVVARVDVAPYGDPGECLLCLTDMTDRRREQRALEKASEFIELRLEQELQRKTEELERARLLQLSMLPESLPEAQGFEVAARMRTASEVGGDYYDIAWHDGERVLAVVGDATGHGLDAGMMVTATKSTLAMIPSEYSPGVLLAHLNTSLRRLSLPKMYMSLAAVLLDEGTLHMSSAGMPPACLFRVSTGDVETITIKSPPLAGFPWFDFPVESRHLDSGDTVLIMTDGFPERFNRDREILGFDAAAEVLGESGRAPLDSVLKCLLEASDRWSNGEPRHDDETFLLVRKT